MPETNPTMAKAGGANIIERCLEQLRLLEGLTIQFFQAEATGQRQFQDGRLRLSGPWGQADYAVEARRRITQDTLRTLVYELETARHSSGPPLLVMAHHINPDLGRRLQDERLDYVDTVGNMCLVHPPLYVRISGRQPPDRPPRASRLFQATGLRLIATLLQRPEALQWTYRELSTRSGVSLGAIGYLLDELREKGYAQLRAKGQLELVTQNDLFFRWEQGYAEQLRSRIFLQSCRPALAAKDRTRATHSALNATGTGNLDETAWASLRPELEVLCQRIATSGLQDRLRLGGELGAALLTGYLRPVRATLHLADVDDRQTLTKLRLIPDPEGPIDLLRFIGGEPDWPSEEMDGILLASPLLIHAELVRSEGSDRLRETAQLLAERELRPLLEATTPERRPPTERGS